MPSSKVGFVFTDPQFTQPIRASKRARMIETPAKIPPAA
jgi:hypothetical protein